MQERCDISSFSGLEFKNFEDLSCSTFFSVWNYLLCPRVTDGIMQKGVDGGENGLLGMQIICRVSDVSRVGCKKFGDTSS